MNPIDLLNSMEKDLGDAPSLDRKHRETLNAMLSRTLEWIQWSANKVLIEETRERIKRQSERTS